MKKETKQVEDIKKILQENFIDWSEFTRKEWEHIKNSNNISFTLEFLRRYNYVKVVKKEKYQVKDKIETTYINVSNNEHLEHNNYYLLKGLDKLSDEELKNLNIKRVKKNVESFRYYYSLNIEKLQKDMIEELKSKINYKKMLVEQYKKQVNELIDTINELETYVIINGLDSDINE